MAGSTDTTTDLYIWAPDDSDICKYWDCLTDTWDNVLDTWAGVFWNEWSDVTTTVTNSTDVTMALN